MAKYILHGGRTREKNDLNDAFFKEMLQGLDSPVKILLIYFAGEESEYLEKLRQEKENFLRNAEGKELKFEIANEKNFIPQIEKSDVIYMRGGPTFKLLDAIKKYPEFSESIKNKVVMGSSAGAYILSKYFYHRDEPVGIFEGLGILPISTHCHYKGDKGIVKLLEEKGLEVVLLGEFEHKVIKI